MNKMINLDSVQKILEISKGEQAKHPSYSVFQLSADDHFPRDPARTLLFAISVIVSGSTSLRINSNSCTAQVGQLVAFPPGSIISFQATSQDLKIFTLFFDSHFLSETINESNFFSTLPIFQFGANPRLSLSETERVKLEVLMGTLKSQYQDLASPNVNTVKYIILAILSDIGYACAARKNSDLTSQSTRAIEIADSYLQLLRQQYITNRQISDYARQMAISTKHLSETVKAVTGRSATFWIDLMLVQEAQILLRQTNDTIAQISASLGFSDQSAFGKFFKQRLQISPGSYRKIQEQGK